MSEPRVSSYTPGIGEGRSSSARAPMRLAICARRSVPDWAGCAAPLAGACGGLAPDWVGCAVIAAATVHSARNASNLLATMVMFRFFGVAVDRGARRRFALRLPALRDSVVYHGPPGTTGGQELPCGAKPAASAARMVLGVQFLETLARDVRVDLRGRQVAVPEQHLHHAQVRAMVEQVRGEGVPQGVR